MSALDLYYSQNLGGGLGGTHLYFPVNRLRTKFHYLYFGRKKPVHGNFVVQYLSKKDSFLENYDIFQVLKNNPSNFIKSRNPSSIFFTLSRRQNINNKFVSQLPEFKYDSSEFYLNESLKSRYNYGFTKLLEEDSNYQQKGDKIFLNFTTKYNKKISENLDFFSDGFFDGAYYFNQDQWVRLFQSLGIQYDIFLKPKIAYNKKILGFGRSPFLHENVYSLQSDEIEFHLEHQFKRYQLKNSSFFDLNKAEFRESKIELNLIKSCWVFGFGANLIQESIYFNFQLN